jgi:hypothetical protein
MHGFSDLGRGCQGVGQSYPAKGIMKVTMK